MSVVYQLVSAWLQYVIGPRYRVRQVGQEEQVVVKGLYDIVSDKVVRVNLLMSQMVVTFPVVIHFTQPLQAFLAGLSPRPAGRERAAPKAGRFWTHASVQLLRPQESPEPMMENLLASPAQPPECELSPGSGPPLPAW